MSAASCGSDAAAGFYSLPPIPMHPARCPTAMPPQVHPFHHAPEATRVFVDHDYGMTLDSGRREVAAKPRSANRNAQVHVREGLSPCAGHAAPADPASLQVNLRGGALPDPSVNGIRYLRLPLDQF